ncbi:hypothetical protein [Pseudorhodoferax sp. Leaf265]|nr:hypothetical protein [Pseudorhodoferax sp. Leaf265]
MPDLKNTMPRDAGIMHADGFFKIGGRQRPDFVAELAQWANPGPQAR